MKDKTVKKHFRQIASSTLTGKRIFGGAFFMHETVGLPLGVQLHRAKELGITLSIPLFVEDAMEAGWTDRTIRKTIKRELNDSGFLDDVKPIMAMLDSGFPRHGDWRTRKAPKSTERRKPHRSSGFKYVDPLHELKRLLQAVSGWSAERPFPFIERDTASPTASAKCDVYRCAFWSHVRDQLALGVVKEKETVTV